MKSLPLSLRRLVAVLALLLQFCGAWMHAASHSAEHETPALACENPLDGHWHQNPAPDQHASHTCVECQRITPLAPLLGALWQQGGARRPALGSSSGPLEFASSAFLPSAPRRGPPQA